LIRWAAYVRSSYPTLTLVGPRQGGATRTCLPSATPSSTHRSQDEVCEHFTLLVCGILQFTRQPGQGGNADPEVRDLRAELLKAEAAHFAKKEGTAVKEDVEGVETSIPAKRRLESDAVNADEEEDAEVKRRRLILEEAQDLDADSAESSEESSDEEWVDTTTIGVRGTSMLTGILGTTMKKTRRQSSCVSWKRSKGRGQNNGPRR
jgi:Cwf15/Cwc15 cell cycle control protein